MSEWISGNDRQIRQGLAHRSRREISAITPVFLKQTGLRPDEAIHWDLSDHLKTFHIIEFKSGGSAIKTHLKRLVLRSFLPLPLTTSGRKMSFIPEKYA
jgi:hypothetical protein